MTHAHNALVGFVLALNRGIRRAGRTVSSVLTQSDPDWRLIIVVPESMRASDHRKLAELSEQDSRIVVVASKERFGYTEMLTLGVRHAESVLVTFLDVHDVLAESTVAALRSAVETQPDVDLLYSNELEVSLFGLQRSTTRKPIWSPEKLRATDYLGRLTVYRRSLIEQIGGLRDTFGGAAEYDLKLRSGEKARQVVRIDEPLVHRLLWHTANQRSLERSAEYVEQSMRAVREHLDRLGIDATIRSSRDSRFRVVERSTHAVDRVSVVIPTRGTQALVRGRQLVLVEHLVSSLMKNTKFEDFEIVVVFDSDTPDSVLASLRDIAGAHLTAVEYVGDFNFSAKCNVGAVAAKFENLVFLNDDMECLSPDVLAQLVAPLSEPTVMMTGAKLLFEDGTIQHAGHVHELGDYRINYRGARSSAKGRNGALLHSREVSGVTGACMGITRASFTQLGGFAEDLPNSFNDVDLCNRVVDSGGRILWLAHVELVHFESKTRVATVQASDYYTISGRWSATPDEYFT